MGLITLFFITREAAVAVANVIAAQINRRSQQQHHRMRQQTGWSGTYIPMLENASSDEWEISRSSIDLQERLGFGSFGEVRKGLWNGKTVAIKILKETMSAIAFRVEADIMKKLEHENLVLIHGVVSHAPIWIVMELVKHKSLLHYMKENSDRMSILRNQVDVAAQVAAGMAYIERMNYVHSDLRAANVLVGEDQTCKIADFGLARVVEESGNQPGTHSVQSYLWTAPEVHDRRRFTIKSDVWSYGILLFEIVTKGKTPYFEIDTRCSILAKINSGYRMPQPETCHVFFYNVMLRCWDANPVHRPTFDYLQFFIKEEYLSIA